MGPVPGNKQAVLAMVMTDYNGATATDTPYGDLDGDGLAEIAVGRLPVRLRSNLADVIDRIIKLCHRPLPAPGPRRRYQGALRLTRPLPARNAECGVRNSEYRIWVAPAGGIRRFRSLY